MNTVQEMTDGTTNYNLLLGTRGTSDSTQGVTVAGLIFISFFLETKQIFRVTEGLPHKFSDYLINHAVNQTTGGPLKPGSILQCLYSWASMTQYPSLLAAAYYT